MKCVNCGTQNADDAKHCRRCGAALPVAADVTAVMVAPETEDLNRTQPLGIEEADAGGTRPLTDSGPKSGPINVVQETKSDTRPLPRNRIFFEPLPERAIIDEDRYLILALVEESPVLNIYSGASRRALLECKQCGFTRNNYGDQYCLQCGASVSLMTTFG